MNNSTSSEIVGEFAIRGEQWSAAEHRSYFARNSRGIDRLAALDDQVPNRSGIDWDIIDLVIQEKLSTLTERVGRLIPNLVWRSGSHRARHIALSSYRIYDHLGGEDTDPIYAGVTIVEEDGTVRISGDISGEESGRIYFDQDCEIWAFRSHALVLAAAVEVAGRLSEQPQILSRAIRTSDESLI